MDGGSVDGGSVDGGSVDGGSVDGGSVDDGSGGLPLGRGASSQKLDQTSALMRVQLVDFVLSILASKRRASSPKSVQLTTLSGGSTLFPKTARHPPALFATKIAGTASPIFHS